MGEIFERTEAAMPLAWTGERLTTDAGPQVQIEHLHRYMLARQLCRGLDVLDVASGEGYGSALLAQTARSVLGVELDGASVDHARANYRGEHLRFEQGDARQLPLADDSVDAVVSFETIEHFYDHARFMAEIRRVLRPGGRLIISSPERDVYSPAGAPPNPHHVHELTRAEFAALLARNFAHVALQGQRPILGSALVGEDASAGHARALTFERRSDSRYEASDGLARPVYLLAIASDQPLGAVPDSLYIETSAVEQALLAGPQARAELAARAGQIAQQNEQLAQRTEELAQRDGLIAQLKDQIAQRDGQIAQRNDQLAQRNDQLAQQTDQIAQRDGQLAELGQHLHHLEGELHGRDQSLNEARAHMNHLETELGRRDEQGRQQDARIEDLTTQIAAIGADHAEAIDAMTARSAAQRTEHARTLALLAQARQAAAADGQQQTARLQAALADAHARLDQAAAQIHHVERAREQAQAEAQDQLRALQDAAIRADTARAEVAAQLDRVVGSSFWRISGPLRELLIRHPRTTRTLRGAARLGLSAGSLRRPGQPAPQPPASPRDDVPVPDPEPSAPEPTALPTIDPPAPPSVPTLEPPPAPAPPDHRTQFTAAARAELLDFLAGTDRLAVPVFGQPDVSVIVVLFNQAHLTLRCLRALLADPAGTPRLQILLFDNGSTDETHDLLDRIDGATITRSADNLGFLLGCNRAAQAATGRTILLLNSDAFVHPGAIAAALATLDRADTIGAVGGRLILPDGTLQEAGSIVWSDGSTMGYGRGLPPDDGAAMFRRDVDYCSGAFLLTPRTVWDRLGGFDPAYLPAYYEESDYCLRVRDLGLRVVYEPDAVVDHVEFGSETRAGAANALSLQHRKLLRARHANALRLHHQRAGDINILPARQRALAGQRRLLVVDNEVPLDALGSGFPRMRRLLIEAAAMGWQITLFPLYRPQVEWDAVRAEIPAEIEIATGWGVDRLGDFLAERQGFYEVILVSRPDNMQRARAAWADRDHVLHGARLIYDAEALFCLRDLAKARLQGQPIPDVAALMAQEVALTEGADAILCVTDAEAAVFRAHTQVPAHVLCHPTALAVDPPGYAARQGFLFVGRLLEPHAPNWQGLAWFLREAWPIVRLALPDATLSIVGRLHPDPSELAAPGVQLIGPLEDLQPAYDAARMFLSPTQFAAGIPIKILDATAAGLPTAGTRLMAEQMVWTPGVEMVADDDPRALADAIVALYRNEADWTRMIAAARGRLAAEYTAKAFRETLAAVLNG